MKKYLKLNKFNIDKVQGKICLGLFFIYSISIFYTVNADESNYYNIIKFDIANEENNIDKRTSFAAINAAEHEEYLGRKQFRLYPKMCYNDAKGNRWG